MLNSFIYVIALLEYSSFETFISDILHSYNLVDLRDLLLNSQ